MANIKAGYLLKITTWENDGDNYNTVDTSGLTEQEVRFLIYVCKKFKCGNWAENRGSMGNKDVHGEVFYNTMKEHIASYTGEVPAKWIPESDDDFDADDDYHYHELLGDLGINSTEYGYWRVFERAEVYLVPEEIKDVSKDFR